jgi:hypothetical protein
MQISINSTQNRLQHSHKKRTGSRNGWVKHAPVNLRSFTLNIELKHHSTLFYDTYIRGSIYDKYLIDNKLLRVETTIKNKAHWKLTTLKYQH